MTQLQNNYAPPTPSDYYTRKEIDDKKYITFIELKEMIYEAIGNTDKILKAILRGD